MRVYPEQNVGCMYVYKYGEMPSAVYWPSNSLKLFISIPSKYNRPSSYMGLPAQEEQPEPEPALPLVRLNHVAFSCTSVEESIDFYQRVLGFQLIQRPASLDFGGAWMHRYGMGIHLLQRSAGCDAPPRSPAINPKGNHISFQCSDMALTKARLSDMNLEVVTARVWDGETTVEQLFFHDPDGNVIEICNCEDLPVVPLAPPACLVKPTVHHL